MLKQGYTEGDITFKSRAEFVAQGLSDAIIKQRHQKHLSRVADAIMEIRRVRRDMIIAE